MIQKTDWSYQCSGVPVCICQQCDNILITTPSVVVDIDECAQNNGGCNDHAGCSNTEGSFACSCNDGFAGDGFTCTGMSSLSESLTSTPVEGDRKLIFMFRPKNKIYRKYFLFGRKINEKEKPSVFCRKKRKLNIFDTGVWSRHNAYFQTLQKPLL